MAFPITERARAASEQLNKQFNIVLEIDGFTEVFGVTTIKKIARIGDEDLLIGNFDIGGLGEIVDQSSYISYKSGTTAELTQVLQQDKSEGDTVTRYQIAIVDKNKEVSKLLAPGVLVEDIIGRRVAIWNGFASTAFRDDYFVVHRGIIDDYKSAHGVVIFNIASQEALKKGEIFLQVENTLDGSITSGQTTATVDTTKDFLEKVTGPDLTIDAKFRTYIQIDDEVMEYQTLSASQFQTLSRGALGTTAASHDDNATVKSFYRIGEIDPMTAALKMLLSGKEGPYLEDELLNNFVRTENSDTVANSIFFKDLSIVQVNNIRVGDYITTTGASIGANNVTLKRIIGISILETGIRMVIEDVTFIEEVDTTAVIDFRSQYDVWPIGAGLALNANEVDVAQHEQVRSNFLSNEVYDFYLKETVKGKDFIAKEIYRPVSCFSIPRKASASVGIHRPPLPGSNIKTLDTSNVLNAGKLKLERSTNKEFFNAIVYKFEELVLEKEFIRGVVQTNATSLSRIKVGNKPLTIVSKGLREVLSGESVAIEAASRRLDKYKFGAEFVRGIKVNTQTGWTIEIGDAVVLNIGDLQMTDTVTGSRAGEARLFDVINKKQNTKNGQATLDVVDTNIDKNLRFGLISPSSFISTGISTSQFIIKPSFNTDEFGINEFRKWDNLKNAAVVIRTLDYSIFDTSVISQINGNTFTLTTPLAFTPLVDYIVELDIYDNQPASVKLLYGFMTDDPAFADGGVPYVMI